MDTAKGRYTQLAEKREPFLRRARDLAALTIPSLMPPLGHNGSQVLPQPYSGLGARAVTFLASKATMAVLPPGIPPLRLTIPAEVLAKAGAEAIPTELERGLSLAERTINGEIERRMWRKSTNTSLQHLIVTGNCLERMLPDNRIKVYRLDQYVVVRSPSGDPVEIIVEEFMLPASMPHKLKAMVAGGSSNEAIPLYTHLKRRADETWEIYQEILDKEVPDTRGTLTTLNWNPIRWAEVVGEDYGRGKCEEHAADLMSVEGLQKSVLEGAAMASRHIQMIRPNSAGGLNLRRRLAKANNGEWVIGNPEDVGMLKFENFPQMQFVQQELQALKTDLSAAFLLNSGMRREGERVTAYEVRKVVEELEGALGGVYTMLNQEMVLPRFTRLMAQMQSKQQLPPWPDKSVEPVILTGLDALGREQDVQKGATAIDMLRGMPPETLDYVKMDSVLGKIFTGLGFADVIRSQTEVQQIQQQRAAMEAMQSVAPTVAKGAIEGGAAPQ